MLETKINLSKISTSFSISGMVLLMIYIMDVILAKSSSGFIPLTAEFRGYVLGLPSIILFITSFVIGYKNSSYIITILLIVGGLLIGTSVLLFSFLSNDGLNASSFFSIVIIGYSIMFLGIFRTLRIHL